MKKTLSLLLALLMLLAVLPAAAEETKEPVTITFGGWGDIVLLHEQVEKFEEKYPWINVEIVKPAGKDWYTADLQKLATEGNMPDVFNVEDILRFYANGWLYDMTELFENDPDSASYPAWTLPYCYVDGKLDYLIATHPDADHIGGLDDVLRAYQVGTIIDSGCPASTRSYRDYLTAAQNEAGAVISYSRSDHYDLGRNSALYLIDTGSDWDNANDNSVVCQLIAGNVQVLFTGDMTQDVEKARLGLFGDIDVLKVGHHGSAYSTSAGFLQVVRPEYAVISYKVGNDYHHPAKSALRRLLEAGATIYGTGKSGSVVLTTDGTSYTFNTSKALTLADAGA